MCDCVLILSEVIELSLVIITRAVWVLVCCGSFLVGGFSVCGLVVLYL